MFALLSRLNNRVTEPRRAFRVEYPLEPLPSRTSFYRSKSRFFLCFTDDSVFTSDGLRNQQTERMWMPKGQNPHWVDEKNKYPDFKIIVLAGIVHDRIIGPYFFKQTSMQQCTRNFYVAFFLPELRRVAPNAYCQQDGASPHNHRETTALLDRNFPNQWMGLRGPIRWLSHSPDLTICDYGLKGDVKAKIKSMNNISRGALVKNISEVCRNYPRDKLRRGREQLQKRFKKFIEQRGGLFQFLLK
ncbi:hypothetical protein TKK_0018913 [Trichogramma kaykai]